MHILIPEAILPVSLARLREKHTVDYDPNLVKNHAELLKRATNADAIIVRRLTQVRGDLLNTMEHCKAVGRLGVGLDNIDVAECEARGIKVIPAPGANARSVAEYVIATAMMLVRTAYVSTEEVIEGLWPKERLNLGGEILGRTIGVVGYGAIGKLTADLARGLGMNVLVYDPAIGSKETAGCLPVSLAELLAKSDVVTLHVPLTPATKDLINVDSIASMKDGAIVINAARGGIIDEMALLAALRCGKLGGAAIDAFDNEPLGVCPQYRGIKNLILTPHIAGVTVESEERVNHVVVEAVLKALHP
ncbi:hydroxyacid dehydrogenase [Comamonas testosteroni]|uniref:hydroxyacid dehydrogenase n=1 Tax=Comamonas testosteroni TaxID=285 RepID=UPI00389A0ECC